MNFSDFSVDDWLFYLENSHAQEIQLGLTRIREVAARLDLLKTDAKIITVAGTNGKGSTVAALSSIYLAAGFKVARYTSPHLKVFNERIAVNNESISNEDLCKAFIKIEQIRENVKLTYFEFSTLAALWYFKNNSPDVIILEVGLGGRLDATNIIDADLAIITTIHFDHQEYLGNTIEEIAYEKAGIIKNNKICVYGDYDAPLSIINQAHLLNAKLYCLGLNYSFNKKEDTLEIYDTTGEKFNFSTPKINTKSAAAALIACNLLQSCLPVNSMQINEGMKNISIYGRLQVQGDKVKTVLDVSHNPQAVLLLRDFIKELKPAGRVHAVFSGLKDKDLCGLINPLKSLVNFWYPAVLSGKRASSQSLLLSAFKKENCSVLSCYSNPTKAYFAALKAANDGDLIVVYGSFFMVSAIINLKELQ